MSTAGPILEAVGQYLAAAGQTWLRDEANTALIGVVRCDRAGFVVRVRVHSEGPVLGVVVDIPEVCPEGQRSSMAEAVARANDGLLMGNFDFSLGTGAILFRNTIPVADGTVTHEQFWMLLRSSVSIANRYHRAFCRLLYGDDLSPTEAIAEVEMVR